MATNSKKSIFDFFASNICEKKRKHNSVTKPNTEDLSCRETSCNNSSIIDSKSTSSKQSKIALEPIVKEFDDVGRIFNSDLLLSSTSELLEKTKIITNSSAVNIPKIPKLIIPSNVIITDSEKAAFISNKWLEFWGKRRKCSESYPGPNPVSISKKSLLEMKPEEYVIAEKTDGVRYSLMLCRDNENQPICVMINRACKKFEINVLADESYFDGSLFDGELAWENSNSTSADKLIFWIFDAIFVKGKSVKENNYVSRFECIKIAFLDPMQILDQTEKRAKELASMGKIVSIRNLSNMIFRPKQAVSSKEIDTLWHNIPLMNHKNDGLIFTPLLDAVHLGTHWRQFKWKYEHTMDLQLRAKRNLGTSAWTFGLYYLEADFTVTFAKAEDKQRSEEDHGVAHYLNACNGIEYNGKIVFFILEENNIIRSLIKRMDAQERRPINCFTCIVECTGRFETSTKMICTIKTIRVDKSEPNNRYTIRQTLLNIEECLTFAEIRDTMLARESHCVKC